MKHAPLTIGTRGSALALRQTEMIGAQLRARFPDLELRTLTINTEADRFQERPITTLGDKGVFIRALERALLDGSIDLAVHSLKDVPADTDVPDLVLAAFSARADPRDVLISRSGLRLDELSPGSRIGTSSLRRRVQLQQARPDLVYTDIRGNVDTRLRKLGEGQYDAVVLAAAGMQRLRLEERITEYLAVERCVPDAGQGIMAVQTRRDGTIRRLVEEIDDAESRACALAERAVVRALEADCRSPVGAHARVLDGLIEIEGMAAADDGSAVCRARERGAVGDAEAVGRALGSRLRSLCAAVPTGDLYTEA